MALRGEHVEVEGDSVRQLRGLLGQSDDVLLVEDEPTPLLLRRVLDEREQRPLVGEELPEAGRPEAQERRLRVPALGPLPEEATQPRHREPSLAPGGALVARATASPGPL